MSGERQSSRLVADENLQGVITPIGAVVTAVSGVKNFDYRFCCLTTGPYLKRDLDSLTAHTVELGY